MDIAANFAKFIFNYDGNPGLHIAGPEPVSGVKPVFWTKRRLHGRRGAEDDRALR